MRLVLALISLLALLGPPAAGADVLRARAVADVSFPFWCDWGYDWSERCWWDDSPRLAVGGDVDKVWRAGVRFDLAGLPDGAEVASAALRLYFDGTCVGPFGGTRACDGRWFDMDVHPIFSSHWLGEREVEIGELLDGTGVWTSGPRWLSWDVTDAVESWSGGQENAGLLVKLADGQEDLNTPGPKLASMSYPDLQVRPILEVVYLTASR